MGVGVGGVFLEMVRCSTEPLLGKTTVTSGNYFPKHPVRISGKCPKGTQKIKKHSFN